MPDWQPYTLPNLEEPNIPLHDLVDWLSDLPGHPEPLTPHHMAGSEEEVCPHCNEVHAEGEKCPLLYGETFTMPPPPSGEAST